MSNKTQLQQNNLEYDSLIELLSGKSIGSNISLQEKTISPTTSSQTVEPDNGYDGLSKVTVNAMPTVAQATPSITVSSSGLITATSSQNSGYVTSGTKSATKQLTTQGAKTITPSTSSQTAVASGVYTTGTITVGAIPSSYVKPTYTKGAITYTPTTSNQTIAAKTYCTGTQTIKGDANLVASNIKSGVSIFGVNGTYGGSGDSGSSTIHCFNTYAVFNDTVLFNMVPDVLTFDADNYQMHYYDDTDTQSVIQNLTITYDDGFITITYQVGESPLLTVYSSDTGWVEDYYKTIVLVGDVPVALMEILCGIATISKTPSSGGQDMLQARVDATNECIRLFYAFNGTNVDFIANLDTSRVTNMSSMFYYCGSLTSIPALDTSQVTIMNSMFAYCSSLTSIPALDTSQVTNMNSMFYSCDSLTSIPALDTSKVTDMSTMFGKCTNLESILMTGMKVNFSISASTKFTREALVTILNNLATVTSTKTLTMGSTNLAKLTDTDKAIATNKG